MSRRLLLNLVLVIFGLALAVIALEFGVRAWFTTRGSEQDRIRYLYDRATIDAKTAQLVGVPYLNYMPNPALDDVNEDGYRGPAVAMPKPDGVFRIVALGGSTTYGHGLNEAESWPRQFERVLHEDYGLQQVEVVNLGSPGYFSLDSVVNLATRGLALEPDLVIVYHGINDAIVRMFQDPACYASDSPLLGMGLDRGIWQYAGEDMPPSALYRLLALRLGWMDDPTIFTDRLQHTGFCPPEPGTNPLDLLDANPPIYFERNLENIIALARFRNIPLLLSTWA
ncbi:MAG: SGNH/GDSL hydrolase family protein, partial [Anaerolineae bacterium]|nr:SGNH/GDSL hydrolase family protein [Anaerolineae bacterium]